MKVVFFHRRPYPGKHFSIEKSFAAMRQCLPADVTPIIWIAPFESRGLWRRIANMVAAAFAQGDVNHITGDIHYIALALSGRRTVLTIHDAVPRTHPSALTRFALRWLWYVLPARRVRAITAVSSFSKDEVASFAKCSPEIVSVVPTCVSGTFRRIDREHHRSVPVVLQVGTKRNKNLERVCEALDGIECTLHIIGSLSDHQRALLQKHRIAYVNFVNLTEEQLLERYVEADVVLFASTYEGFGMPIIEAQIVGRPVVTSQCTSMPEVAGGAACLVDPWQAASIRAGLLRVLHDSQYRAQLVELGFQNAQRFTAAAVAAEYARLYRQVGR